MISHLFYRFRYESETREQNSITSENHTKEAEDTYEARKKVRNTDHKSEVSTYSQESKVVNSKE